MSSIIVNGCYNCPFRNDDNEFPSACNLDSDARNSYEQYAIFNVPYEGVGISSYDKSAAPASCPLRTNEITVKFKEL